MDHEYYMRLALAESEKSALEGNDPFAAVVVDPDGRVVWAGRNRVREELDPTAHAETTAIRDLCRQLGTLSLAGYSVYSTSEPCVTCFSACLKAKISAIYYGAETEPTASLPLKTVELAKFSTRPILVTGGILGEECLRQREDALRKN